MDSNVIQFQMNLLQSLINSHSTPWRRKPKVKLNVVFHEIFKGKQGFWWMGIFGGFLPCGVNLFSVRDPGWDHGWSRGSRGAGQHSQPDLCGEEYQGETPLPPLVSQQPGRSSLPPLLIPWYTWAPRWFISPIHHGCPWWWLVAVVESGQTLLNED